MSEIGYLGFVKISELGEEKSMRGAILLTDLNYYPIEIRYTDVVNASTLEKIAYGINFKRGLAVDKIISPLIEALETKPNLIFIDDEQFLRIQNKTNIPICNIDKENTEKLKLGFSKNEKEYKELVSNLVGEDASLETILEPFDRLIKALEHIHFYGQSNL